MNGMKVAAGLAVFLGVAGQAQAAEPYAKLVLQKNVLMGSGTNVSMNHLEVLGAPDDKYLSMGGPGAYILLDMGATPIVDGIGPDLEVREYGAESGGVDEQYRVSISATNTPGSFVVVGTGSAYSLMDIASTGLSSARYVYIEDLSTATNSSNTPGSDIDAVTSLHASTSGTLPSVTGLSYTHTNNGVRLSWTPITGASVTGYNIRRSSDGKRFDTHPKWSVTKLENAFLDIDTSKTFVGPSWYAVSAKYAGGESALQVVGVPASLPLTLLAESQTIHVGDSTVPAWVDTSGDYSVPSGHKLTLNFTLPEEPRGPTVKLNLQAFDVDYARNYIVINGHIARSLPQGNDVWLNTSLIIESGEFQQGGNTLEIYARDNNGGDTVNGLDDFMLKGLHLTWMP